MGDGRLRVDRARVLAPVPDLDVLQLEVPVVLVVCVHREPLVVDDASVFERERRGVGVGPHDLVT